MTRTRTSGSKSSYRQKINGVSRWMPIPQMSRPKAEWRLKRKCWVQKEHPQSELLNQYEYNSVLEEAFHKSYPSSNNSKYLSCMPFEAWETPFTLLQMIPNIRFWKGNCPFQWKFSIKMDLRGTWDHLSFMVSCWQRHASLIVCLLYTSPSPRDA